MIHSNEIHLAAQGSLASEKANYVTGVLLPVDAGVSL